MHCRMYERTLYSDTFHVVLSSNIVCRETRERREILNPRSYFRAQRVFLYCEFALQQNQFQRTSTQPFFMQSLRVCYFLSLSFNWKLWTRIEHEKRRTENMYNSRIWCFFLRDRIQNVTFNRAILTRKASEQCQHNIVGCVCMCLCICVCGCMFGKEGVKETISGE